MKNTGNIVVEVCKIAVLYLDKNTADFFQNGSQLTLKSLSSNVRHFISSVAKINLISLGCTYFYLNDSDINLIMGYKALI